ncbi:MAG: formylglycine-generating enzyme family protein [Planctomycetota bacterium]|nr:formylglycine-generating enzyme family protein [Planctomycetota bacterium]
MFPTRTTLLLGLPALLGLGYLLAPSAYPGPLFEDDEPKGLYPELPEGPPPVLAVEGAEAEKPEDMRAYTDRILGTKVTFDMVPIPGGRFRMGSRVDEPKRKAHESPVHEVQVSPFWMGACEVTWDEYHAFMMKKDLAERSEDPEQAAPQDRYSDAVTRPTPPYVPMDFNMGVGDFPAIAMTQFAAKQYTKWLTMKTGRFHRLATEAEWEYACRAGTTTAYSFGSDTELLDKHAWHFGNSEDGYKQVGKLQPNAWGLHDMHGNVAEWVLDGYRKQGYQASAELLVDPVDWPVTEYPRVVRGGSWDDDPDELRSASRRPSKSSWKDIDPQIPKSIWYHTNVRTVGFRVVRPLTPPPRAEWGKYWEADLDFVADIEAGQRAGKR